MPRYDLVINPLNAVTYVGAGTNNIVKTPSGVYYAVFVGNNNFIYIRKSTDGIQWTTPFTVYNTNATVTQLAVWYDRWSGINGDLIHMAYSNSTDDDILYRNFDCATDTFGTQVVVFAGVSTATGGALTITRARGGNLVISGYIDAGAEGGAWKSTDVGATWGATIANPLEAVTSDFFLLAPGWNADTQDVMMFFWDASANEVSVKGYDDSANTWTETSIATGMTETVSTNHFPHFNVAVDLTNSQNLFVAWSNVDTLNADLRMWTVNDTTITEKTNVVLNSTDDQGLCAIAIDTSNEDWYVFYGGKSDGSETFGTAINLYYKKSTDDGATWGAETKLTNAAYPFKWLVATPHFTGDFLVGGYNDGAGLDDFIVSVNINTNGGGEFGFAFG